MGDYYESRTTLQKIEKEIHELNHNSERIIEYHLIDANCTLNINLSACINE